MSVLLFRDREQGGPVGDIEHPIHGDGRCVDRVVHNVLADNLHRPAMLEHHDIPILIAEENLAVDNRRGAPDRGERIVDP